MQKWEYDITEPHKLEKLIDILDAKGQQGWELVTVLNMVINQKPLCIGILKRPVNL